MTKRTTISNIPDWLQSGVSAYQERHGLQSWSQAAIVLMAVGLNHLTVDDPAGEGYIAGTKEAEDLIWAEYETSGHEGSFEEWLIDTLGNSWGGQRENAGRRL